MHPSSSFQIYTLWEIIMKKLTSYLILSFISIFFIFAICSIVKPALPTITQGIENFLTSPPLSEEEIEKILANIEEYNHIILYDKNGAIIGESYEREYAFWESSDKNSTISSIHTEITGESGMYKYESAAYGISIKFHFNK